MESSTALIVKYFLFLSLALLLPENIVRVSCSLTLPLIFANSQNSPLYIKNLTRQQKIEQLVHQTLNRARCISSARRTTNSAQPERVLQQELCFKDSTMLMKIGIGTFQTPIPYKTYYLLVDTGSDLIWLQCEDCQTPPNKCFENPPYPKTKSSTYHQIPCGTHELCYRQYCRSGDCPYECSDGFCSYHFSYDDDTEVMGYMALERFTFDVNPRKNDVTQDNIFNLVFGCNSNYKGDPIASGETGMIGLGWGARSFISQVKTQFDDVFSYCVSHYIDASSGGQGYLKFGLDDNFDPKDFSTVALRRYGDADVYYLNLNGISVLGRKLEIDPSIFIKRGNTDGTIIDSGTTLSVLIEEAYEELKKVLIAFFESQVGYYRTNPGLHEFEYDLCYKETGHSIDDFPAVTLLFEGADLKLESGNTYIWLDDPPDTFCLAILPSENEYNLIGAYQQSNFQFVFDRRKFLMHFRSQEKCGLGA